MLTYTNAETRKIWLKSLDRQIEAAKYSVKYLEGLRKDVADYDEAKRYE